MVDPEKVVLATSPLVEFGWSLLPVVPVDMFGLVLLPLVVVKVVAATD